MAKTYQKNTEQSKEVSMIIDETPIIKICNRYTRCTWVSFRSLAVTDVYECGGLPGSEGWADRDSSGCSSGRLGVNSVGAGPQAGR